MSTRTVSTEDFHTELNAQSAPCEHLAFVCPACGTVQSAADVITIDGASNTVEIIQQQLGVRLEITEKGGSDA